MDIMVDKQPLKFFKKLAQYILIAMVSLLVISMFLGPLHLLTLFYEAIISPNPYYGLINVEDMYALFSVILIIVVAYELVKSILLIIHHDSIPVKSILKIAAIAIANKIITLNVKQASFDHEAGIGIILLAVGIAFYFFNQEKTKDNES